MWCDCVIVFGCMIGVIVDVVFDVDCDVIFFVDVLFKYCVGFIVLLGNFFDSVIMKMLVVGEVFW